MIPWNEIAFIIAIMIIVQIPNILRYFLPKKFKDDFRKKAIPILSKAWVVIRVVVPIAILGMFFLFVGYSLYVVATTPEYYGWATIEPGVGTQNNFLGETTHAYVAKLSNGMNASFNSQTVYAPGQQVCLNWTPPGNVGYIFTLMDDSFCT